MNKDKTICDLRLYAKNSLTIKAKEGFKIKKMEFSMTVASDKYDQVTIDTGTGEMLTENNTPSLYTWTSSDTSGSTSVTITPSKQFNFSSFKVTYVDGDGETGGGEPVDPPVDPVDPPVDPAEPGNWELVTSESLLGEGMVVTFTTKEYTEKYNKQDVTVPPLVMKELDTDKNVIKMQEFILADGSFDVIPYEMTLYHSDDNWMILAADSQGKDKYVSPVSNKNTITLVDNPTTYSITVEDDGNALIQSTAIEDRYLRYNPNLASGDKVDNARISFYKPSSGKPSQQAIYMYRKVAETPLMPWFKMDEANHTLYLTCPFGQLYVAEEDVIDQTEEGGGDEQPIMFAVGDEEETTHNWVKANNGIQSHKIDTSNLTSDRMLYAKAVYEETGKESKVAVLKLLQNGTVSAIENTAVDAAVSESVYYDMQGRRVAAPAVGNIYIRVTADKVEKIVIR